MLMNLMGLRQGISFIIFIIITGQGGVTLIFCPVLFGDIKLGEKDVT